MKSILLITIASLGMIGCVGGLEPADPEPDPDPDPIPMNEGRVLYDSTVHNIMAAKCAGCHTVGQPAGNVTGFVESDKTKAYDTMVNYVALVGSFAASTAPLLTKVSNGHQGITYTQGELGKITVWLDKELELRNPGIVPEDPMTPPGPETGSQATRRLIKEWSGCMTKADFATANMAQGVGGWQANNNQECDNCHATAGEGFLASRDATFFFDNLAKHSSLIQQYYVVDLAAGIPTAKIVVNRVSLNNVATRSPGHTEHPTFNAGDGTQGINAIVEFHTLTAAHAGTPATCEVPAGRLVD